MAIAWLAIVVAVVGALLYAFTNGKPSELGRILFFCGAFVFVLHAGTATVRLSP